MYSEVGKGRVQKRRREKLPVDLPPEGPVPSQDVPPAMETELASCPEADPSKAEPGAPECPEEKPIVPPLQPSNGPLLNPMQPRDSKCVRISDEPPITIPKSPRSVPRSSSSFSSSSPSPSSSSPSFCQPVSFLSRCVHFALFVFFLFLGFVRTLAPRPSLPSLPLPFKGPAVVGKNTC